VSAAVPFSAVLRSEWTKLRSLRSTWWTAAVYVLAAGGFGWLAASTTPSADRADTAVGIALIGFGFAQVGVVVTGVLAAAGEFASGMVLASLASVPRRVRWLAAKTGVVAGAVAVLTAGLALTCWLAVRTFTAVPGGVPLLGSGVPRELLLQVAGAALTGVLAVALGALLGARAGGGGVGMALVFLLPLVLPLFGDSGQWLSEALPVLRVGGDPFLVAGTSWPVGLAVTAGWAAGMWALAAVLLVHRDV
jgi:ABC-2 type transport system permease protein